MRIAHAFVLVGIVTVLGPVVSVPAEGADTIIRRAPADNLVIQRPSPYRSASNWTGLYGGVNVGYGWGRYKAEVLFGGVSQGSESLNFSGASAGGQIGANFQSGNIVWGIEADIQRSWMDGSKSWVFPGLTATALLEIDWFATLRGRVGVTNGPSLLYLTGGIAHGEGTLTATVNGFSGSASDSRTGWTIGAGYESALPNNWSWKLEYLYLDFGDDKQNLGGGWTLETPIHAHLFRFGANHRFGF